MLLHPKVSFSKYIIVHQSTFFYIGSRKSFENTSNLLIFAGILANSNAMVITFANQKGGVGKSTLALLFANWLIEKQAKVFVLDLDRQATIYDQRERDKSMFTDQEFKYEILQYEINTPVKEIIATLLQLKEDNKDNYIIIDAPGSLDNNGLIPFLVHVDAVICPFEYENRSLASTGTFLLVLQKLLEQYKTNPKQIYLPNKVRINVGLKSEKEQYAKIEEIFCQYGVVSPVVKDLACLSRANSIALSKEQKKAIDPCFSWIKDLI